MMSNFSFLLLIFLSVPLSAQPAITKEMAPSSSRKHYDKGVQYYKSDQYGKAIASFQKALKQTPGFIDAELQWASVCYDLREYECAENHFLQVLQLDSNFNLKIYYTLALTQYQLDNFLDASINMKKYLEKDSSNIELRSRAQKLLPKLLFADSATKHPVPINPVFLKALNTAYKEYLPTISADGKTCVFTRRSYRGDEDLFISHFTDSTWTDAVPLYELNTPANEGSPALSQDGNTLIFVICDKMFSLGGCDLYYSEKINDHWTEPLNLGEKINTPAYESQACFAENGNVIYFTSNRKGGFGGNDIWYSYRKDDRSWALAKNLGPAINTPGNEECPFVHPNGSVLYFSSDELPGMGDKDLFYSLADEKGNWQKPVNLGYPINTKGAESSFIVFPDGQRGWMSSNLLHLKEKDLFKQSNLDLFEISLPDYLKVKSSTYVELTVTDKQTGKPVQAKVTLFDLKHNRYFYKNSISESGNLLIALPTGTDYGLHVYHKDYVFEPDQFTCTIEKNQYDPMIVHKKLEKISGLPDKPVVLKNILFEFGSAVLMPESFFELNALVQFLKDNTRVRLKITGHTDDIGSDDDNIKLSGQRALAVVEYLKQKGISESRLMAEGKGETLPVDSNISDQGRQNNRRIEFTILHD